MSAIWYWSVRTLRSRVRSYVGVAMLVALLGGLALASVAGARRTASAYPRFREASGAFDVRVDNPGALQSVPGVTATAPYIVVLAYPLRPDGSQDPSYDFEAVVSVDGVFFTRDRFKVTQGRLPDASRPDEVAVNEHLAQLNGVRVGQRFEIGVFDPAEEYAVRGGTPPPPVERVNVTVTGIGLFPEEVAQDDTDRLARMLFTPALAERVARLPSYTWTWLDIEGGAAGVDQFKRDYNALLPPGEPALIRETSVAIAQTQEAVRPVAVALGGFGLLAALATLLLGGQAVARLVRADRDDLPTMRALGASPSLTIAAGLPGAAASILAGVMGAGVFAVAVSPLAPIGPLRRIEAHPGVFFEWTVLSIGMAGLALALSAVAVTAALRQAPHRRPDQRGAELRSRSVLGGAVSAAGLPVPAVVGARLALEGEDGGAGVPLRAALGGAVAAVTAVVAALVFGSSLQALVDEPRRYGWDWDVTLRDAKGFGGFDLAQAQELLGPEPSVAAWSGGFFQTVEMDGRIVQVLGVEPGAAVGPPLTSGRPVMSRSEVVLGAKTLAALGKRIGDTVVAGTSGGKEPLKIVGTAVLPTVGPAQNAHTSLGQGAMVLYDHFPGWDVFSPGAKVLFIRLSDGIDRMPALDRIAALASQMGVLPASDGFTGSAELVPVQRPAQIVNYAAMGATPAILAGVLLLAALFSLGLTLASAVERRRRDLSILKSLGFTRRQVSSVVVWQSSIIVVVGLVVGVPLGIAVGRWSWILFAERLPVLALPQVPGLALAAVAGGVVILANLVAAVPARRAGRTPVAAILRSE